MYVAQVSLELREILLLQPPVYWHLGVHHCIWFLICCLCKWKTGFEILKEEDVTGWAVRCSWREIFKQAEGVGGGRKREKATELVIKKTLWRTLHRDGRP